MEYKFEFENPFDVEAEWIVHLRGLNKQLFDRPDLRKTVRLPEDLEEKAGQLFQSLPAISNGDSLLRFGVPPEEKRAVQEWEYYHDFFYMLSFLSRYTEQLTYKRLLASRYFFSITHAEDGTSLEFESLNGNVEETGLWILPKLQTINDPLDPAGEENGEDGQETPEETGKADGAANLPPPADSPKHWAADRMAGIQGELSNTFYVEVKELVHRGRQYCVANSLLGRHVFPEGRKSLRIAVCPVAHRDLLEVKTYCEEKGGGRRLCSAEGLKCAEFVHDRIRAAIIRAGEERADFVIFPEMLGDGDILDPAFLNEIRAELRARGIPMPGLILLPTWWHEHRNELYVLDAAGRRLCVQQKQEAYLLPGDDGELYAEDLWEPEPVIHLVHVPDVGSLMFPVCRDLLEDGYIRLMLRQLRATFLLCPAYSPAKTQFDLVAPGVIQYGCYVIWCNTCAAYCESKRPPGHIGLAVGPQEPAEPPRRLVPACGEGSEDGEGCGDAKNACVFLVEISMDRSAAISCKHIYK